MTTRIDAPGVAYALYVSGIFLTAFGATPLHADTPNLEFGDNGWVRQSTYEGLVETDGSAVALQADGKIVVAGYRGEILDELFVARYNVDGTLDTTFDNDGFAIVNLPGSGRAKSVKIQSDQKIVVAGTSRLADANIAVARLNPDGSPDNTFGTGGVVTEDLGGHENIEDMLVQADGKILVAGRLSSTQVFATEALLVRYNSDGSRDNSFDTDGVVLVAGEAQAVALQADNKIVVGGSAFEEDMILIMRFNADGSLDTTFDADGDNDGIVEVSFGVGAFPYLEDLTILPDQRIVTVGSSGGEGGSVIHLLRFESDGSTDTTFDEGVDVNGRVDFNIANSSANASSIVARSNGKVAIAGRSDFQGFMADPPAEEVFVAQFNSDGTLDTGFDTDGVVTVDVALDERDSLSELVIDASDRVVAVGDAGSEVNSSDLLVARFTSSGLPDATFSGDGIVLATLTGPYESSSAKVVVQQDCRILAGGFTATEDNGLLSLVRYNLDGSLDTTFGGTGIILHSISPNGSGVNGLALQSDGKILVADASRTINDGSEAAIVRFLSNGVLDTSFGSAGTSLTDIVVGGDDTWYDVLVLPDDKILATGITDEHVTRDLVVARFNSDGSIDPTFGIAGVYRSTNLTYGRGLAVAPDGKYLVAGADNSVDERIGVLRLNTDGSLDTSFGGGDGLASSNVEGSGGTLSNPLAVQSDGKILITGAIFGGANMDLAVARFTADGLPDAAFDGDGLASSDFGSYQWGREIGVQDDGKIIVAGYHNNTVAQQEQFMTVRYNSNGSVDGSYGNGGLASFDYQGFESRPYGMAFGDGHVYLAGINDSDFGALLDLQVPDVQFGCELGSAVRESIVALPDANSTGSPDVGVFVPASNTVHVRDGLSDAVISDTGFGPGQSRAVEVIADLNNNGAAEIATLSVRASGQVVVTVRDSRTGALINTIFYGTAYSAIDMAVLPDSDGNGAAELAVLGVDAANGVRVQARDALSDLATSTTFYGNNATAIDVQVVPDVNGNGKPEIAVHARVFLSGQSRVQFRDSFTSDFIRQVFFGTVYAPLRFAVIDDVTGDGIPEIAQLAQRTDTGAVRIQVKNPVDGLTVSNAYTGDTDRPIAIVGTGGMVGMLVEGAGGVAKVIKRNALTGSFVGNVFMGAIGVPRALVVIDNLNGGSGDPEFAALGDNAGQLVVQIKDTVSGAQVNTIGF